MKTSSTPYGMRAVGVMDSAAERYAEDIPMVQWDIDRYSTLDAPEDLPAGSTRLGRIFRTPETTYAWRDE